ncbi:hypothetical protein [Staphylospora marina]|uniref:hypothetical protein n=1 Tax=Staphylospora marina TaxID=2490858 RepID=UPI000F5BE9F2|nr:hypothetical protein [Staphylospora marina]
MSDRLFASRMSEQRLDRIEEQLEETRRQLRQLMDENRKLRKNQQVVELVLLEEMRMLISLLKKEQPRLNIHSGGTAE